MASVDDRKAIALEKLESAMVAFKCARGKAYEAEAAWRAAHLVELKAQSAVSDARKEWEAIVLGEYED